MFPQVSTIIMFLNGERFLREAIESIFAQTYQDWELLLVDDGSSDSSPQIALQYVNKHPSRVRYIEHPGHHNRGMSASRNLGISHARGQYIAFLDADDVWFPQKLEEQIAILSSHPEAALVYGLSEYWTSWNGNSTAVDTRSKLTVTPNIVYTPPFLLRLYCRDQLTSPSFSNIIFRKELADRVGGFEEPFHGMFEDQAFLVKVLLKEKIFIADKIWDRYRDHPDSCVARWVKSGKTENARHIFLRWFQNFLLKEGLKETECWDAVQQKLWPFNHPYLAKAIKALKRVAPTTLRRKIRSFRYSSNTPHVGHVRFGDFRRKVPISRAWGIERGLPVDRYYIEKFLLKHKVDIRGRVLEIQNDTYTRRFGGEQVHKSEVLDLNPLNPKATLVADLSKADQVPSESFDCIILTQTLHLIYDTEAALRTLHRILKPGGVLLATFPGISNTAGCDAWYWCFTTLSAGRLFERFFPPQNLEIKSHGNVLAATAFLQGLAVQDITPEELDFRDSSYELVITVRAFKN